MSQERQAQPSFEQYSREQLEIYAGELAEHIQRERHLRRDLEQRVRELEALNRLFQQHLEERFQVAAHYRHLAEELRRLSEWASSQPLPDLRSAAAELGLPGLEDDSSSTHPTS